MMETAIIIVTVNCPLNDFPVRLMKNRAMHEPIRLGKS